MQTVNEERYVLLTILLIITEELVAAFTQAFLEASWIDSIICTPHEFKQLAKRKDQVAFEAHYVPHIRLLKVELIDSRNMSHVLSYF